MSSPLRPAENIDLREQVFRSIKTAITEGAFRPGEKLSETDLAERLKVSRTPVREAIRQLAKTGLVCLKARKGAFVTCPTREDARQLYELRAQLENYAVTLVAKNLPVGELGIFRSRFAAMTALTPADEYLTADKEFHCFLYRRTGNRFLEDTLLNLQDLINLYRPYSTMKAGTVLKLAQEHMTVIDALLAGNQRAPEAMTRHIANTYTLISEALA